MRASLPLLLVLCLVGCGTSKVPESVALSFSQKFPGIADVAWSIDANGYWEGHFQIAERKLRADFTRDGLWVETEDSIHFKDLPGAVQAAIEKDFVKKDIVEIEQVDNAERGAFYDVEFKSKGMEKFDVEFREDGVLLAKKRR